MTGCESLCEGTCTARWDEVEVTAANMRVAILEV